MPPRIPVEIAEKIIDICAKSDLPDYGTLVALNLLCHALRPRAKYNLYQHVTLHTVPGFRAFLDIIRSSPKLGTLVSKVTISPGPSQYMPFGVLGEVLHHTHTVVLCVDLDVYPPTYLAMLSEARSVHHLHINRMVFKDRSQLRALLRAFTGLRTLSLNAIRFRKRPPIETPPAAPLRYDLPGRLIWSPRGVDGGPNTHQ